MNGSNTIIFKGQQVQDNENQLHLAIATYTIMWIILLVGIFFTLYAQFCQDISTSVSTIAHMTNGINNKLSISMHHLMEQITESNTATSSSAPPEGPWCINTRVASTTVRVGLK